MPPQAQRRGRGDRGDRRQQNGLATARLGTDPPLGRVEPDGHAELPLVPDLRAVPAGQDLDVEREGLESDGPRVLAHPLLHLLLGGHARAALLLSRAVAIVLAGSFPVELQMSSPTTGWLLRPVSGPVMLARVWVDPRRVILDS